VFISVLILTLNEEINLPECLASVSWSNDVVVLDSYSTDRTVAIARAAGARVIQRAFDDYASQRNAALRTIDYKNPWVLMVDADERWDATLYAEMIHAIAEADNSDVCILHFTRRDMFMGKWLKHSPASSTWAGRLVRLGTVSVNRSINEEYHTEGRKGYLHGQFVHHPFSKGITFWLERHTRYASMEAQVLVQEGRVQLGIGGLFSADPVVRRKWFKRLAYRLPFRPLLVFCYLYFVRRGLLDGTPGLMFCQLRLLYEYMIDLKVKELRCRGKRGRDHRSRCGRLLSAG
jgi:glycosyltransferase involved in cell wall biosynthesis